MNSKSRTQSPRGPLARVRNSAVHGYGVFAVRRIRKGTRIFEYLGERISHAAADLRYADKDPNDNHTFLFVLDAKTVIDAGVNGGDARYVNHSCDPNCESVVVGRRIFIDAVRTVQPGEELAYDYAIVRDHSDPKNVDDIYACRCGASGCRGSMLAPRKKPPKKPPKKPRRIAKARAKAKV
jgi:uncharacterized protein